MTEYALEVNNLFLHVGNFTIVDFKPTLDKGTITSFSENYIDFEVNQLFKFRKLVEVSKVRSLK